MAQALPGTQERQGGYVLLMTLVTSMALFVALGGILSLSLANLASAKRTMFDTGALYAAESGVDNAVFQINATNATYTGTNSVCPITSTGSNPVTVFNDTVKGKGTYETCVTAGTIDKEYIVFVVGKVYKTSTATSPVATRKLKVVVQGSPAGAYAVQTGPGGLIMRNSSNVSQGPIYIGGYLTMENSSSIGTPTLPIQVDVANARCPVGGGATYPTICASGTFPNPITISGSQAHIYGVVNANNQTNSYATAMTDPGLVATSGVTAPTLPSYDRVAHAAAVTSTITASAAECASNNGSVTWAANVKIVGDVTIDHSCTVTVNGNAWITGNLRLEHSAVIKTGATVTTQPTIMVDGSGGVRTTQTATVATNAGNIGMEFITFHSANTSCSLSTTTNCVITGTDLYNSKDIVTVDIGNQGAAAGSVFYARWSKVTLGQAGSIGALLGQTIDLGQSGNLVFTSTVVTGNYSYDVRYYEYGAW